MQITDASNQLPFTDEKTHFTVKRIICVGRNYSEHAREMGHNPDQEPPFYFFKPVSALLPPGQPLTLPEWSNNIHHEVELVVAIGDATIETLRSNPEQAITGLGVGLDMTARDIQQAAKDASRPWCISKGFDSSAPCSRLQRADFNTLQTLGDITLMRNNNCVQQGSIDQMIWPVDALLKNFSQYIAIQPGDLIYTGTPAGVGPVTRGDTLKGAIKGLTTTLNLSIQ